MKVSINTNCFGSDGEGRLQVTSHLFGKRFPIITGSLKEAAFVCFSDRICDTLAN